MLTSSIQYQVSNVIISRDILYSTGPFFEKVLSRHALPHYLNFLWQSVKNENNPNVEFNDIDKDITENDFKVTEYFPQKNLLCILIEYPDYEYHDAASKYGFIVAGNFMPTAYFTFEYGMSIFTKEPIFFVGRWIDNKGMVAHANHGQAFGKEGFIKRVFEVLHNEYPNEIPENTSDIILNADNSENK